MSKAKEDHAPAGGKDMTAAAPEIARHPQGVTAEDFCRVMGSFATGVAIVTTAADGNPFGMTINSLTSVSLDPLTLLVCLARNSMTADAVMRRKQFVVNLLRADQQDLSHRFVSKAPDRFSGVEIELSDDGLPMISGVLGHVICQVESIKDVGDHFVVFGRVTACRVEEGFPLLYYRRAYHRLAAGNETGMR